MGFVITLLNLAIDLLILLIIVRVFTSYFLSPYHPFREALDRILEPLLGPIRRMMPNTGMIDFSPMVLIILLYIFQAVMNNLLRSL